MYPKQIYKSRRQREGVHPQYTTSTITPSSQKHGLQHHPAISVQQSPHPEKHLVYSREE